MISIKKKRRTAARRKWSRKGFIAGSLALRSNAGQRASVSRCVFSVEWKKTGAAAQETARVAISVSDMTAAE